jgi:hypothetical protein|tara:strand:- start:1563 stop:1844 length:282 start_codon:yes stop_codon:yes gene_type:complete
MARKKGLIGQMADQMNISTKEAGGLMSKAKKINNMEGYQGGGVASLPMSPVRRYPGMGDFEGMRMSGGGIIKGRPFAQKKGGTFNDNDGKGTF